MKNTITLYSEVQLVKPLPEFNFEIGDVATVVEVLTDGNNNNGYLLEFFDNNGDTLKVVAVAENAIALPLEHSVVNYRPYKAA